MCVPVLFMVLSAAAVTGVALPVGTTPNGLDCGADKPIDIYFLLDCSSSVWIVDYDKQLDFVVSFINQTYIAPNATRVGLGIFSDSFYPVVELGKYPNKETLIRLVKGTPYLSGNTYTGKGLNGMRTHGFAPGVTRDNVTKVGVVVTDGKSQQRSNTVAEARSAREAGIWIFVIGVGGEVDTDELDAIASEPRDEFSFQVQSFDNLPTLVKTLSGSACSLHRPQADNAVCGQKRKADIMFVYNAAGMANRDVLQVRKFIQDMAGKFSMMTGNVRAGVISEGCQRGEVDLGQYLRPEDFVTAISSQSQPQITPLLKKLRLYGYQPNKGGRREALKMAVVFVDEAIASPQDARYEALLLKYDNVLLHVIAVGSNYREEEVKNLATSTTHVTKVSKYEDLLDQKTQTNFVEIFCETL